MASLTLLLKLTKSSSRRIDSCMYVTMCSVAHKLIGLGLMEPCTFNVDRVCTTVIMLADLCALIAEGNVLSSIHRS